MKINTVEPKNKPDKDTNISAYIGYGAWGVRYFTKYGTNYKIFPNSGIALESNKFDNTIKYVLHDELIFVGYEGESQ